MPKLTFAAIPGADGIAAQTAAGSLYQIITSETLPWNDKPDFWLTEFVVYGPEGTVRLDEIPEEDDLPLARTFSIDVAKAICQAHYDAGSPDIDPCPVYHPEKDIQDGVYDNREESHEEFAARCLAQQGRNPDGTAIIDPRDG
jgi:hypothetical protein